MCVCLLPNAILEKLSLKDLVCVVFFFFFCESVARNYLGMSFKVLNVKLFFGPYPLDFFLREGMYIAQGGVNPSNAFNKVIIQYSSRVLVLTELM